MSRTLLLIIVIILLLAVLPTWPYSSGWGYYPSGGLGVIVIIPSHPPPDESLPLNVLVREVADARRGKSTHMVRVWYILRVAAFRRQIQSTYNRWIRLPG